MSEKDRLRMKIAQYEFEAEGTTDYVNRSFVSFIEFIMYRFGPMPHVLRLRLKRALKAFGKIKETR